MGKDCGKAECFVENPNYSVGIPVKILGIGQGSGSFRGKTAKAARFRGKMQGKSAQREQSTAEKTTFQETKLPLLGKGRGYSGENPGKLLRFFLKFSG